MSAKLLDLEHPKPCILENLLDGQKRQVGIVLVIDRVELHLLDQIQKMREFDGIDCIAL
jgi:hypothetical protein